MVDREKVIKGLTCCMAENDNAWPECESCPYNDSHDSCTSMRPMFRDAIALLKAQEPIAPVIETHWETPSVYDEDVKVTENKCGACGAEIDKWDKYCRVCGQAVKWE